MDHAFLDTVAQLNIWVLPPPENAKIPYNWKLVLFLNLGLNPR